MSHIQRFSTLLFALALGLVYAGGPAVATPKVDRDPGQIEDAIEDATRGDTTGLAALLDGPLREETQQQLREWLESEGELEGPSPESWAPPQGATAVPLEPDAREPETAAVSGPAICGGAYECFCTGYNGVSMGWYGEPVLACHGYLDQYISGTHVSHTIPDLFPVDGGTLSLGCALAAGGVVTSVMAIPITAGASTYGWAVWGSGALFAGSSLALSCG